MITEDPSDPFSLGDDDEDDNDAAGISVVGGLGDTVWKDLNGNGIQDPGEPGVPNVVVNLLDCEGNLLAIQLTDENGFYFFNNLLPGDYQLQFDISDLPSGCAFTQQDQGGDALDSDVNPMGFAPCTTIQGGEYDSTFDAGLLLLVNIGDFVWHDLDGDGAQDSGEPGIPGVEVFLFDEENNMVAMTTTDQFGNYLFENVYPDTYFIVFSDPEGFDLTTPDNTDDENDSDVTNFVLSPFGSTTDLFTIEFGQEDDLSFDAGYFMCVPIGELVWYDIDEDDIHDDNENGLNGLVVNLYQFDGTDFVLFDSQFTGHKPGTASDDGYYKFCAPPGSYYVEVVLPPLGLVTARPNQINTLPITNSSESTVDSDMTNDFGPSTTAAFTVFSGDVICNIGSGYYPMGTAGNRVWFDSNQNGIQDDGEDPVADVIVQAVVKSTGEIENEVATNAAGMYTLEYLRKDDYYLKFVPPTGYGFTISNVGSDDTNSDVDHTNGLYTTKTYSIEPGLNLENIDAGIAFGVLPLTWVSISASRVFDDNHVRWSTTNEVNTSHFVVEVATDASSNFREIGRVDAHNQAGLQDYLFVDTDSKKNGTYYYRVQQIDLDGQSGKSETVVVKVDKGENVMVIYPNPAVDNAKLSIELTDGETTEIDIYDAAGRFVRSYSIDKNDVGHALSFDIENLEAGVYSIRLTQGNLTITKKFIVLK